MNEPVDLGSCEGVEWAFRIAVEWYVTGKFFSWAVWFYLKTGGKFFAQFARDFPEFAEFLVECGIDSISLNPDTVIKTSIKIVEEEQKLGK